MRCRDFERDLPDWNAGRLQPDAAGRMLAHERECAACADDARAERMLRAAFRADRAPNLERSLWPMVEARISAPAPRPRFALPFLSFRPGAALAGALAAGIAVAAIVNMQSGTPDPSRSARQVPIAEEQRMVNLLANIRSLPEPDAADAYSREGLHSGEVARTILLGGSEP